MTINNSPEPGAGSNNPERDPVNYEVEESLKGLSDTLAAIFTKYNPYLVDSIPGGMAYRPTGLTLQLAEAGANSPESPDVLEYEFVYKDEDEQNPHVARKHHVIFGRVININIDFMYDLPQDSELSNYQNWRRIHVTVADLNRNNIGSYTDDPEEMIWNQDTNIARVPHWAYNKVINAEVVLDHFGELSFDESSRVVTGSNSEFTEHDQGEFAEILKDIPEELTRAVTEDFVDQTYIIREHFENTIHL